MVHPAKAIPVSLSVLWLAQHVAFDHQITLRDFYQQDSLVLSTPESHQQCLVTDLFVVQTPGCLAPSYLETVNNPGKRVRYFSAVHAYEYPSMSRTRHFHQT